MVYEEGIRVMVFMTQETMSEERKLALIGASLSESHTSVTSLHSCVCMFACLD